MVKSHSFAIFDSVPSGICIVDVDFRIVYMNSILLDWIRLSEREVLGKELFSQFPNLNQDGYRERFQQVLKGGPPAFFSAELHRYLIPCPLGDGKHRIQQSSLAGFTDSLHIRYGVLAIQDVSLMYGKIRELRENYHILNRFLAVCSHDLKTPLNVIIGLCQLMEDDENLKESLIQQIKDSGCNECIHKPFTRDELLKVINRT